MANRPPIRLSDAEPIPSVASYNRTFRAFRVRYRDSRRLFRETLRQKEGERKCQLFIRTGATGVKDSRDEAT